MWVEEYAGDAYTDTYPDLCLLNYRPLLQMSHIKETMYVGDAYTDTYPDADTHMGLLRLVGSIKL